MGAKYVQLTNTIEFPTGTNRRDQFSSFNIDPIREMVESLTFGDASKHYDLGVAGHKFSSNVVPDADDAFIWYLFQRMEDGAQVPVLYRKKTGAKAADNLEYTFNVKIHSAPQIGGQHGQHANAGDLTLEIDGPLTVDNGTTTITIG